MRAFLVSLATVLMSMSLQVPAAQRLTEADLSVSALEGYTRTADSSDLAIRIQTARGNLQARAASSPDQETSAAIFFTSGFTPEEIEALASNHDVEISSAELKVLAGPDQRVFTIFLATDDLLVVPGSLSNRLRIAIGHYRAEFLNLSKVAPADEAARYLELAKNRSIRCFRIDVIGKVESVNAMSANPRVAAAFLQESSDLVEGYKAVKRAYDQRHTSSPTIVKGPRPSEDAPLRGYTIAPPTDSPISKP